MGRAINVAMVAIERDVHRWLGELYVFFQKRILSYEFSCG